MKKLGLLLLSAALAVAPLAKSYAVAPDALGGSAFPLTFISTSPINLTDGFNQMLQIINAQCAAGSNPATFTVQDSVFKIQDDADATKQFVHSLGGQTTGTTATFSTVNSANATYTFPGATDTICGIGATQTLTNKTLTSPTINTPTTTGITNTSGITTDTATVTSGITLSGTIASQGITFGNALGANPVTQTHFQSFTAAQVSAGVNVLNSAASRLIYPGAGTIMVSGTASGATNVVIECYPSAAVITTIPISALIDGRPIPFSYTSSAGTASATQSKAAVAGCSSADAVLISGPALATTTQVFVNLPYVVQ